MTGPGSWLLPLLTSALSLTVAGLLAAQWARRRRPYQAVWGAGMVCFGVAAGAEAVGHGLGWSEPLYRVWYLAGAVMVAAWLGVGQVYLLRGTGFGYFAALAVMAGAAPALARVRPLTAAGSQETSAVFTLGVCGLLAGVLVLSAQLLRPGWTAHVAFGALLLGTLVVGGAVLSAPVDLAAAIDPRTGSAQGSAFPERVRLATPLFNIAGAAMLVLGAGFSAWLTRRRRAAPRRALGSGLIALGALAPTVTSSLLRLGTPELAPAGQLLGVALIAVGFLVATRPSGGSRTVDQAQGSTRRTALPTR